MALSQLQQAQAQRSPSLQRRRPASGGRHRLAPQRKRPGAVTTRATVQPDKKQQVPPEARPVRIDLFETKDAPAPAPAGTAAGGSWLGGLLGSFELDTSEPMSFDGEEKTEYDPLRDGPLRYLGYANELGEAFAAWLFAGGVPLSYAVAIGYVCFDTGKHTRVGC